MFAKRSKQTETNKLKKKNNTKIHIESSMLLDQPKESFEIFVLSVR